MNSKYKRTLCGGYISYFCQAIVNNLLPLLFVTLQKDFHFSLAQLSFLVTANFAVQIVIDALSAPFIRKLGYKASILFAHAMIFTGLVLLGILPFLIPPYAGLLVSIFTYGVGSAILEVVASPMIEALPTTNKSGKMSLLHSFYCWGHMLVILLSTGYFLLFGVEHWRFLPFFWAIFPVFNFFLLLSAPVKTLPGDDNPTPIGKIFKSSVFWMLFVLMICAGASEQAMAQWSSYFAESALNVTKALGDLLGPCMFAFFMGLSRTLYGYLSRFITLHRYMVASAILCIFSYLLVILSPIPVLALAGCGLCGLSVAILWPGVYSLGSRHLATGGSAMFALLAIGGDLGCTTGPGLTGMVASAFGDNLKAGFAFTCFFPILILILIHRLRAKHPA